MNAHAHPSSRPPCEWPDPPGAAPLGDGRCATACFRPESVEVLGRAVREHVRDGLAIYPQGGRTALDYGGTPARPGVAMDVRGLDAVVDYPHADMTITVQAGITAAALVAVLDRHHQRILIDVPQADRATLGGVFATGACGPRRLGLGRPRDQVLGVRFVGADGVEVKGGGRVVKNVAGYDLPKLLTGSLGTLGILTEMTLKVRPKPEATAVAWLLCPSLADAGRTLEALNTSEARPVAIDLLSPTLAPEVGRPLGLPAHAWTLAIGLEGNSLAMSWQVDRLTADLGHDRATIVRDGPALEILSALTELTGDTPGPFSCIASVPPSGVVPLVAAVDAEDRWAVHAHAGSGIIRLHALGEWTLDQAAEEVDRIRTRAIRDGGSFVIHRCDAGWKDTLLVWGPPRPDWAVAARIKQALDPRGSLNPGRFVGGI